MSISYGTPWRGSKRRFLVEEDDIVKLSLYFAEMERMQQQQQQPTNDGSNIAVQNSQSNPTKEISRNFLGAGYAHVAVPSLRPLLHSQKLRSKGTPHVS
ncbi:hypothetical protein HZH66_003954 [Vespula vulgaris]|uniref:Uncharacterized protein n=1 Tax=Vespula vulgaris TaxID=7454 RepID=A0A834NF14_VESVU|nr:hypothetical protein HZH66_003954 [Vespula vulgaris]